MPDNRVETRTGGIYFFDKVRELGYGLNGGAGRDEVSDAAEEIREGGK